MELIDGKLKTMYRSIQKLLLKEKDNLEDEILSCLTHLNMYDMLTPDELGMTDEAINADKKKEAVYIDKYVFPERKNRALDKCS